VLFATAGLFLARLPLLPYRRFDPDEFEHAHAAWCVSRGMLLYKDFFEHHTPWYYYLLRPFFHWFDVAGSLESAKHFLLLGRGLSFLLSIVSAVLVLQIGRCWEDRRIGPVAALLLVSQSIFLQKSIEMRPDALALPFYLGGLAFLLRGLTRSAQPTAKGLPHFLAGGVCVGAAIMCTQKMLFVLPGALAGLGLWSLAAETKAGLRSRILSTLTFVVGVCVPVALTAAAFALNGAGREFITNNFLLNAKWKPVSTYGFLRLLRTSGPVLALALLAVVVALRRFFRSGRHQPQDLLLACIMIGLFAGIAVIPSAHRQYYLIPLPIACLFAAQGLFFLIDRAAEPKRKQFLAYATILLAVIPVASMVDSYLDPNDVQLARLRQVFERTKPTDLVMDGWEGMGVFRPHAFRYFFLHDETMQMLPRESFDAYLDTIEGGQARPKLIAMDKHLAAL